MNGWMDGWVDLWTTGSKYILYIIDFKIDCRSPIFTYWYKQRSASEQIKSFQLQLKTREKRI